MFYIIKDNKLKQWGDYKFNDECQELQNVTSEEYNENPNKYILDNGILIPNPNWEEEQAEKERERIASLNLTKADFWIALLDGGITKAMVKEKIELIPDETLKAKTLIRLDEADHFWRGDASMDIIGGMFGLTPEDLTYLFENKELPEKEPEPVEEEENVE